jgi:hypothetical protein
MSGANKRGTFGVSLLSTAGFQSPLVRRAADSPLPKPFTGVILASKPPDIWRMSVELLRSDRCPILLLAPRCSKPRAR